MNEPTQDILFDLLTKKAIYGLDESEQRLEGNPRSCRRDRNRLFRCR